jgi:non-ribosomal peptide synthetase component F
LQSFEHQDYPFEDLVAMLQLNRDRSRNPLFDVAFILHNMYTSLKSPEFYDIYNYPYHNGVSLVDLALEVHETVEGISCNWEYSTSLFQQETVQTLGKEFMKILAQLICQPNIPIGKHPCLHKNVNIVEDVEFLF